MRKEIYESLIRVLSSIPEIRHIDLWNQNVEFLDEDSAFPMPAVFVEFGQISWTELKGRTLVWDGSGTVNLHIVTEWHGNTAADEGHMPCGLSDWDLAEKIQDRIQYMSGTSFRNFGLLATMTNHNHEDIVDNIEVYRYKGVRCFTRED